MGSQIVAFRRSLMKYKRFDVRALEREPGKWRASIRRVDGKPVKVIGRKKLYQFETSFDAKIVSRSHVNGHSDHRCWIFFT